MERIGNEAGLKKEFEDLREVQLPKVKQRTDVDVLTYCGLDKTDFGVVKHLEGSEGDRYIGETTQKDGEEIPQGHGIIIDSNENISIAKFNGWSSDIGPYLSIWKDGRIKVCEWYLDAKQQRKCRYTQYKTDGTITKHGY